MKKIVIMTLCFVFSIAKGQQKPKLVIGIVVDQMKAEYLDRFYDDYSPNGFKRLMANGFTYYNMNYNYMPTYTAPGHASIFTGATPETHGIIGNEWFDRVLRKNKYCTEDATVKTLVAGSEKEGMMSPRNLIATTVADEFRMATNFKGKAIGLSIKDRGAILPVGHFANWAFWYSKSGNFISSSYYGDKLPEWVTQFNNEKHYLNYIQKGWDLLKPKSTYNESIEDDNRYEGRIDKSKPPVFPYDLNAIFKESGADIIRTTPYGNDLLADLAIRTIEKENLGKNIAPDFLTVSFSSTDYIGHTFGPRSMEIQDTYLRLDETIARFLNYLDKSIGKDNYLIFLTADHAAAENPNYLSDHKYNVTNTSSKEMSKSLEKFSIDTYGVNFVMNYSNFNLFLERDLIKGKGLDLNIVKEAFKTYILQQPQIKRVYTDTEILASSGGDYYLNFVFNGFDPKQNGDLVLVQKTGFMEYHGTGTTHGTPNSYDTNVPLIFYGVNVPKGESYKKEYITSIAPTLSKMLKITFPNGTQAEILEELLNKK